MSNVTGPPLLDCGCGARVHCDGSKVEIDFCPLHDAADDLLALTKKLADECAECHGRGYTFSDDGITGFGPDDREPTREECVECADIRAVIAKAEAK